MAFLEVADRQVDFGARGGECAGCFDADAGAGAGDEEDFVGECIGEVFVADDLEAAGAAVGVVAEVFGLVGFGVAVGHFCCRGGIIRSGN